MNGDWQAGLAMINTIRAAANAPPVSASTQAEAFDRLKKERAIVMWLESRRGGDLLRWGGDPTKDPILVAMASAAPGSLPLAGRAICSPFSQTLLATNPALGAQ